MKFWKKALATNLIVIGIILFALILFLQTKQGQAFGKTALLVSEVIPKFPIRPIKYMTKEPVILTTEISSDGKKVPVDIYKPNDSKKHPAIVITLGILATRQNSDVIKLANAFSRLGYVVLVPDIPNLISGFIWTDSVDMLVSSVDYLEEQDFVVKNKIGFAGFCVGGSLAISAAEDKNISDKVDFMIAISPYYDAYSTAQSIVKRQQKIDGKFVTWLPATLTDDTIKKEFTYVIADQSERATVLNALLSNKELPQDYYDKLSSSSKGIYDFFHRSGEVDFNLLPESLKQVMLKISPSNNIQQFKAKLFLLTDKNDTFVPKSESLALFNNLQRENVDFELIDSFEHVNPATKLPRWSLIKQLWFVGQYVYNIISYSS